MDYLVNSRMFYDNKNFRLKWPNGHFVDIAENRIKLVLFEKQITLHNYGGFFIESIYTL